MNIWQIFRDTILPAQKISDHHSQRDSAATQSKYSAAMEKAEPPLLEKEHV